MLTWSDFCYAYFKTVPCYSNEFATKEFKQKWFQGLENKEYKSNMCKIYVFKALLELSPTTGQLCLPVTS